jgi:predicted Holliday junction resolvase-like endonuclease
MKLNKRPRRFKNRLYISVLMFLGALSLPVMNSCNNSNMQEELKRKNDSIAAARKQDSLAEIKKQDSIKSAMEALRQDSIRKADSLAKAKAAKPSKPAKPVNPFKPDGPTITKYGVPADLN